MAEEERGESRIQGLFKRGKEFTEDLIKENKNLRLLVTKIKTEKKDLEDRFIDDNITYLQQKVDVMEQEVQRLKLENQSLREQFLFVEDENREFAERYHQVEKQNSDLISLYVASYNLHSTLNYDKVIGSLKEIVINLIGSETFGVYLLQKNENHFSLVDGAGLDRGVPSSIPLEEPSAKAVMSSGQAMIDSEAGGDPAADPPNPIACIPLKVDDRVVGVVGIYGLLVQKKQFEDLDYELFELLGTHAGAAIFSAKILAETGRLDDLLEQPPQG